MSGCKACTTEPMAGPVRGTLANGERCDACEHYPSDVEAAAAITQVAVEALAAMRLCMNQLRYYPGSTNVKGDRLVDAAYDAGIAVILKTTGSVPASHKEITTGEAVPS